MKKNQTAPVHPLDIDDDVREAVTAAVHPAVSYPYLGSAGLHYPGFYSTYNQQRLGAIMARLEQGSWGMAFSSGMAAITTAILSFVQSGDHIIFLRELYGGTLKFATDELPKRGVACSFVGAGIESFKAQITPATKIMYIESPSNPLLNIVDVPSLAALARKHGIITIIDNTFASPVNQVPLAMGIDIAVESGTKYLGGHNDLPFGTLASGNPDYHDRILATARLYGGSLTPNECYLAERSIKTLFIRVKQQNEGAQQIAAFLQGEPYINNVYYPGLATHPQHALAARQMNGFGGMVSFELDADEQGITRFQQRLRMIAPALSLGGVESLMSSPMLTSHRYLTPAQRGELGISDNLLRLSVGIEDTGDLMDDIRQAAE
jgi:cysteine-S-conjugate beta-lyase